MLMGSPVNIPLNSENHWKRLSFSGLGGGASRGISQQVSRMPRVASQCIATYCVSTWRLRPFSPTIISISPLVSVRRNRKCHLMLMEVSLLLLLLLLLQLRISEAVSIRSSVRSPVSMIVSPVLFLIIEKCHFLCSNGGEIPSRPRWSQGSIKNYIEK